MATVLVVDDLAVNRELLLTLVTHLGHRTLEAADGAEALALVRQHHPALVISDILMPTMDGYELVRQLRADPDIAGTEVIFYSAHYREREVRSLAASCGVTHVLIKPCEPQDILHTIELALAHTSAPVSLPDTEAFDQAHLELMTNKLSEKIGDLEYANSRLGALMDLHLHLASERDPLVLLEQVCRGARDLIGAKFALLGARDPYTEEVHFFGSGTGSALVRQGLALQLEAGLLGQVLRDGQARRVSQTPGRTETLGLPEGTPSWQTALLVPLASLERRYGWICLADKLGALSFSAGDEQLLSALAAQVGRIYENGSLYAQARRDAQRLHQSEEQLRQLAENIHSVFFLIDVQQGRSLYVSPAYETIWGRSCASVYAEPESWLEAVHPDDQATVHQLHRQGLQSGTYAYEFRIIRPDGEVRWIRSRGFPVKDAAGMLTRITGVAEDISERKEAEQKVERLSRVYAVLSSINTLIVRVHERAQLFQEACHVAVRVGGFQRAWIGLLDATGSSLELKAIEGLVPAFLKNSHNRIDLTAGAPFYHSMAAQALRSGTPVFTNNLRHDPLIAFKEELLDSGTFSMTALPLVVADKAVGVLVLVSSEENFFDAQEMRLLTELAGDIAFALDHLDKADRLNYLAYYDEVTGLPNNTLFQDRTRQQLEAHTQESARLAIVLVDVARFRIVAETLGRQIGDAMLRLLAQRIQENSTGFHSIARMGIDRFGLALYEPRDAESVAVMVEQLLRACFATPFAVQGNELRMTGKAGIALSPMDGADSETLVRNAEAALQRAKSAVEPLLFYAPEMNVRAAEALNLEGKLRIALELQQFVLYYQPKVSLATGALTGAEALIRWQDPKQGLVPPGQFIPMLEETGLIYDVGRWALRQAVVDSLRWRAAGLKPGRIAVNVSPLQLRHHGFVADVAQVIGPDTHAAQALELEITESRLMDDVQRNIANLKTLRDMGVSIALDDFGTGYSSLGYLAQLPADALKIDRSFIVNMTQGSQGLALVSTIISLAHSLQLKVIAEGVETEEQARLLRLLNCDEIQGFLCSKPLSAEAFEARFLGAPAAS